MKPVIIMLAMATIAFASCEKVVEFDIEDTAPKVVVMAQGNSDSLLSVRLTYSRFFLDEHQFKSIDNATVSMRCNGVDWPAATYADTIERYFFQNVARHGDSMLLTVNVPGHEQVTASCRVPFPPQAAITSVNEQNNSDYDRNISLHIRLTDPADQSNFYRITLKSTYYWLPYDYGDTSSSDTMFVLTNHEFECSDYAIIDQTDLTSVLNGETTFNGRQLFFNDDKINGQTHDIVLRFNHNYGDLYRYQLVIEAYPRDLYLYERSITQSNDDMGFLSEPTQIHCNMSEGAIGIFGIKARYAETFYISDTPNNP